MYLKYPQQISQHNPDVDDDNHNDVNNNDNVNNDNSIENPSETAIVHIKSVPVPIFWLIDFFYNLIFYNLFF